MQRISVAVKGRLQGRKLHYRVIQQTALQGFLAALGREEANRRRCLIQQKRLCIDLLPALPGRRRLHPEKELPLSLIAVLVKAILRQNLPVVLLAALFLLGIWKKSDQMIRGFSIFASFIRFLITVGLVLGAVQYMTGFTIIPGMAPLEDAMAVVSSIGIVMLGSLPISEILQRVLRRPFSWAGKKAGINEASVAGLLIGMVSVIPVHNKLHQLPSRIAYMNLGIVPLAASAFFFWIHPAQSPVFSTFGLSEPKCGGTVYGPCFRG